MSVVGYQENIILNWEVVIWNQYKKNGNSLLMGNWNNIWINLKQPLAILLIFSLLSPYLVSAQSEPCQDKEFLRLKDVSINDMSDREYKYFMMMSKECADNEDKKKLMLKLKPKLLWFITGIAILYYVYDEVIDDDDEIDD